MGLADYPNRAFDYVILSQTLQETRHPRQVLREMVRVGRRVIVAFPNFGHWRVRLSMLFSGRAPRTKLFPYEWYDSPNIHFLVGRQPGQQFAFAAAQVEHLGPGLHDFADDGVIAAAQQFAHEGRFLGGLGGHAIFSKVLARKPRTRLVCSATSTRNESCP